MDISFFDLPPPPSPSFSVDIDVDFPPPPSPNLCGYESDGDRVNRNREHPETTIHQSVYEPASSPTYEILIEGTNKGKTLLTDGIGFTYSMEKKPSSRHVSWRCSSRPAKNPCKARVGQCITSAAFLTTYAQEDFKSGPTTHNHSAKDGYNVCVKIVHGAKQRAVAEKFRAPREIIMEQLLEQPAVRGAEMPHIQQLTRRINYLRSKTLPPNPRQGDLLFVVHDLYFPPGWYRGPVFAADGARHLVFYTDIGLRQLGDCPRWYVDETFKLVTPPFVQLWTISGYLKNDKRVIKQVPLLFVLMTRRRATDYSAVFFFLLQKLPLPRVTQIVSDFERAVFKAVELHWPAVDHTGCNFHWAQAVVKKTKDLGLFNGFCHDGPIKDAVNFLLTLPLLPANKIRQVYYYWKISVTPLVSTLLDYVERNWVNGTCWKPERWSVYQMAVRTNNGAEGNHRWWNNRGKGAKLAFYPLTEHLYKIAIEVPLTATLLCHKKISKYVRKEQDEKNAIIFSLWDDHLEGKLDTMQLWSKLVDRLKLNLHADYTIIDDEPYDSDNDPYDMDLIDPL